MILPVLIFISGLVVSVFHWSGIILSGFGLAFFGKSLKAKFGYGVLAGLVVWVMFLAYLMYEGIFSKAFATGMIFLMSFLFSVILGGLSGLVSSLAGGWKRF